MGIEETKKKKMQWDKENTMHYGFKLQKSTDSDIIAYMEDKPKQTTIKKALRLLIKSESKNN